MEKKNFLGGFHLDPNRRTSQSNNLLGKIKSEMLENGALWASFNQNGALHSRHEKPQLWHSPLCPHEVVT